MAEIVPPTTTLRPTGTPFVRNATEGYPPMRTFAFVATDGKPLVRQEFDRPLLPPDPPDVTNPVVGNFSPANGSTLAKKQSISFTVTDNSSLIRKIFVCAIFLDGEVDTVYDGDRFTPRYVATSTVVPITDGFSFSVRPILGWDKSPTIRVYALDYAGNEN